jgi:predicted metalloprotease
MRWEKGRRSGNVEDQRGRRVSSGIKGGGIGILLLALIGMYFGIDPSVILNQAGPTGVDQSSPAPNYTPSAEEQQLTEFVSVVLADTEDPWKAQFNRLGATYSEPKLVLFTGAVETACGVAQAAMGPFYCPADQKVYMDLSFYQDLKNKMNAPGDFAQAYVISHEVGHHVQNLLGISDKVQAARGQLSEQANNQLSVRLELQADCLAGIWAHHADRVRQLVEPGDIDEALNAASQIGDDRLQKRAGGYVTPDSFTHGSSEQRVRWFRQGFNSGEWEDCNTFEAAGL